MRQLVPDVIILELGSNDLVELSPQTAVGSELESLVRELYEIDSVQFVVVGQVSVGIHRTQSSIIVRWASFTNILRLS